MLKISALVLMFLVANIVAAHPAKSIWKFGTENIPTLTFGKIPSRCEFKRRSTIYFGYNILLNTKSLYTVTF